MIIDIPLAEIFSLAALFILAACIVAVVARQLWAAYMHRYPLLAFTRIGVTVNGIYIVVASPGVDALIEMPWRLILAPFVESFSSMRGLVQFRRINNAN